MIFGCLLLSISCFLSVAIQAEDPSERSVGIPVIRGPMVVGPPMQFQVWDWDQIQRSQEQGFELAPLLEIPPVPLLSPVIESQSAFAFSETASFDILENADNPLEPSSRIRLPSMRREQTLVQRMVSDQLEFYSRDSLPLLLGGLTVGGLLANTRIDQDIQSHLHSSLVHASSDSWLETFHANKELGDGMYTLPVFAGAWALGEILPESQFSEASGTWGERTLRGFMVGGPPVLFLQHATGGSRPNETDHGSHWHPFTDNNGVSGHAFMGSLPFITAAKMTDSIAWKTTFYAASTLAPISRASDSAHYPSQVALGWWLAFLAASSVHATDNPNQRWRIYPTAIGNGSGLAFEYRF